MRASPCGRGTAVLNCRREARRGSLPLVPVTRSRAFGVRPGLETSGTAWKMAAILARPTMSYRCDYWTCKFRSYSYERAGNFLGPEDGGDGSPPVTTFTRLRAPGLRRNGGSKNPKFLLNGARRRAKDFLCRIPPAILTRETAAGRHLLLPRVSPSTVKRKVPAPSSNRREGPVKVAPT